MNGVLPIRYAGGGQVPAKPIRHLRLAGMQVLVIDSRKQVTPQARIEQEREMIAALRRDHQIDAAFFCEASHDDYQPALQLFREEGQRSDVYIGFGQMVSSDQSRYWVIGPAGFSWEGRKRTGLVSPAVVLQPNFNLKGVRMKVEICGDIGAGRELLQCGLMPQTPTIDLLLNPSAAPEDMMNTAFMWAAGGYRPRAYLGVNSAVFYGGEYGGGKSTYAAYDNIGGVKEQTSLDKELGILVADFPISEAEHLK